MLRRAAKRGTAHSASRSNAAHLAWLRDEDIAGRLRAWLLIFIFTARGWTRSARRGGETNTRILSQIAQVTRDGAGAASPHSGAVRSNSHSSGSAPRRARACATELEATVFWPSALGNARSSGRTTSVIGRSRRSAMPMTSQTTCSAGSRRFLSVAVPVVQSASSIHARSPDLAAREMPRTRPEAALRHRLASVALTSSDPHAASTSHTPACLTPHTTPGRPPFWTGR
jgi:hypothetical protein